MAKIQALLPQMPTSNSRGEGVQSQFSDLDNSQTFYKANNLSKSSN